MSHAPLIVSLFCVFNASLVSYACSTQSSSGTDSNTSWLAPCRSDSDCRAPLQCLCGACTLACDNDSDCAPVSQSGRCVTLDPSASAAVCGASVPSAVCTLSCADNSACPSENLACSGGACLGAADNGTGGAPAEAGTETGSVGSAGDSGPLQPIEACVPFEELPLGGPSFRSDLASLCEALGRTGGDPCPASRAALLAEIPEQCIGSGDSPGAAPQFYRGCADEISGWYFGWYFAWYFDSASGALVGARISDTDGMLPCGTGLYFAGQWDQSCGGSISCSLCVGNPDECPPDISAEIPTEPCGAPPAVPDLCDCPTVDASFSPLPTGGTLCGTVGDCLRCQSGTCWADCVCMRDGNYRWNVECTE